MAKLKTNHTRQGGKGGGNIIRVGLFAAILGGLFTLFNLFLGNSSQQEPATGYEGDTSFMLPESKGGQIVHHRYFTLAYNEEHEQAEWVAYVLKKEELEKPRVDRSDEFTEDPLVKTGSATLNDYRGSGYDRGHLIPAADRAFSEDAIQETFLLSNITPQAHQFNSGIWRELEETTREWAKKYDQLYIVTGPVLTLEGKGKIGENEVTIPVAYYKVILDLSDPELKAIGFVIPNEISYEPLFTYAVAVDDVEELTGIDFFPELLEGDLEEQLEREANIDLWTFYKNKFDTRLNKWNNQ